MNLYIMTRGRVGKQETLKWIPKKWKERTWLVCPEEEKNAHGHQTISVKESVNFEITNYSQKFQWILDGIPINAGILDINDVAPKKLVILDDDLVFSRKIGERLITERRTEELEPMFEQMESLLDKFALVGIHPRQLGHLKEPPYVRNGRIFCVQGINRNKTRGIKVDQHPILADVILNCTLLSRGLDNALITTFFQDHGPSQAPGGCSLYRTAEMQREAVEYVASRWPEYVKVEERRPKVAKWLGEVRYDYRCQWKQLYAAGVAHLLDPGAVPNPDKEARREEQTVE